MSSLGQPNIHSYQVGSQLNEGGSSKVHFHVRGLAMA